MSTPRVSTIIPVYNREGLIGRAIESALAQSYPNQEIIVVDDGSTDDTCHVIKSFGERVCLISQPNRGPYAARNLGLKNSSGEYVAFLDSDDFWHPERLAKQVPLLETNKELGIVFGNGEIIYEGSPKSKNTFFQYYGEPARGWVFPQLLSRNFIPQSTVLVRRECFKKFGAFLELPLGADFHKWLQVSLHYQVDYVEDVVFTYTMHSSNISRDRVTQYRNILKVVEHLSASEVDQRALLLLRRRAVELEFKLALVHLYEGAGRLIGTLSRPSPETNVATRCFSCASVIAQEVQFAARKTLWKLFQGILRNHSR